MRTRLLRAVSPVSAFVYDEVNPHAGWLVLHVGVALTWVVVLTLWYFYQYYALVFMDCISLGRDSIGSANSVLAMDGSLWMISFGPALAFGIAWLGLTTVFCERRGQPILHATRPPWPVSILGAATNAICVNLLVWRITPITYFVGLGRDHMPTVLDLLYFGKLHDPSDVSVFFDRLSLAGTLGASVVFLQIWCVLRTWRLRVALLTLSASALILGVSAPSLNLHHRLPLPVPGGLLTMKKASELDIRSPGSTRLGELYFATHDADGEVIRRREYRWSRELSVEACHTCVLPVTILASTRGIPVDLAPGGPNTPEPTTVLEVPLSGEYLRVYDLGEDGLLQRATVSDLSDLEGIDDWLILKLDIDLKAETIRSLLEDLREVGVKRVSLAAIPYGYVSPPTQPPILIQSRRPGARVFEPTPSPRPRKVVTVRRYVPPPDDDSPIPCHGSGWTVAPAFEWVIPANSSLGDQVTIELLATENYQDLIVKLDRAIAGGASRIYLVEGD